MRFRLPSALLLLALPAAALGAKAKPAPPPEPPAPAAPAPLDDAQRGQAFTAWATALASGNQGAAADALVAILDDPTRAELQGEAWGHLGELYEKAGLKIAAIGAYGKALSLDAQRNAPLAPKAIALVQETDEPGLVAEALGNNVGIPVEGALRNQLAVIAAKYQIDHDSYGPAVAILLMGDRTAADFEDVEMLRGVALSQQGRHTDAIAPFLTAQAMGVQAGRDENWQNVLRMDVARAYYSAGNYGQAIAAYATVDRSSDYWLDAQFERAWAHFRGNDTNGALAMLFNHQTPFFEDFYQPEADLLRAYSSFVMCKFTDASQQMEAFTAKYTPIQAELQAVSVTPEEAFADVAAYREGKPTKIPAYLLRPYRHEEGYDEAVHAIGLADDELQRATATFSGRAGEIARDLVQQQREAHLRGEGERVLRKLDAAKAQLTDMLSGIEITKLDLLNLETKMYERAAQTGTLDYGNNAKRLRDLKKSKPGFRVWPWQGEAWADELGWYVFDARPDCPDSLSRGKEGEGTAQ